MNFDRVPAQSRSAHTGGVAQLAGELRGQPFGSVVVLEGERAHRLQLAQAIARHLGYGANLSAERKWNLDALNPGSAPRRILFFDEADALFGSRTDVKNSHDRYANLFDQLPLFRGLLLIGADSRHSMPPHLLARCKMVSVRDYWPPRE
jgi:hypothetical protein